MSETVTPSTGGLTTRAAAAAPSHAVDAYTAAQAAQDARAQHGTRTFRVWRGDRAGGKLVDYTTEVTEGMVVLDAIHQIQAEQANDLAVRWNCKAGKCGSCSAEINGKPRLMCMTRLSVFDPAETITVTPLRAFPVVKDLVTDVKFNYEKAREVPAFTPPHDNVGGKFRMQQVDVERGQEFRKCIECFLCQNTCHVIRDHDENKPAFAGPRRTGPATTSPPSGSGRSRTTNGSLARAAARSASISVETYV